MPDELFRQIVEQLSPPGTPSLRTACAKHLWRPRAHRAVGRLPPASQDRSAGFKFQLFRERPEHRGGGPERQLRGLRQTGGADPRNLVLCRENEHSSRDSLPPADLPVWPCRDFAAGPAAGSADPAEPDLPWLRRPADAAGHPELLERGVQPAVHPGRRAGPLEGAAGSLGQHLLPRRVPDRLHLVLLPLGAERLGPVLGPPADDLCVHGDPRQRDRGADRRAGRQAAALAAGRARRAEPADLDAGRRSQALRLGAVLSLHRLAADVLAVAAEIHRDLSTGSSPRASTCWPSCWSTTTPRSIRRCAS